jgi:hypothetical protein
MSETITVPLTPDEDGYVGRTCPSCEQYFKVRPGTGLTGQEQAYCPYCDATHDASDFTTPEQIELAKSIALRSITEKLNASIRPLNRTINAGLINISITAAPLEETPIAHYQEARLETPITCTTCTLDYKIYGVFATCPDCGTHNTREVLLANLNVLRASIDTADDTQREDLLKNAVGAFDAFGKATTEHDLKTAVGFQNLQRAEEALQAHGRSLRAHTTREEWEFLTRSFQKRHVLTHNLGVIDEQYLQRASDPDAILGRKVRITSTDVERTLDLLERLAAHLTATVPPPAALPERTAAVRNPYHLTANARALATLLFQLDTDGMGCHRADVRTVPEQLGIDELHVDAAVGELTDRHLVENEHGWLRSTHHMPLALPDEIDYSPTADDQHVAAVVLEAKRLGGQELADHARLPIERLNRSVRRLHDKRAIELSKAMGTAPFVFYEVRATGDTLRYLDKLR